MGSLIRLASEQDAASIAAIYRPIVSATTISFETEAPSDQEIRQRIRDTVVSHPWLVFERDGAVIGYAYASRHRARAAYQWSVDMSAYVDERFRRLGVGHALYLSLLAILRAQGFANAYAGIALPNPASVALHEKLGFVLTGTYRQTGFKLGQWLDVGHWQRDLAPRQTNPREPQPFAAWLSEPQNGRALG